MFVQKRELSGILCIHAVLVMLLTRERPKDYVDECYSKSTQMKIYSKFISPINGSNLWISTTISEPILSLMIRRPPGRPHKKKWKETDETIEKGFKLVRKVEN